MRDRESADVAWLCRQVARLTVSLTAEEIAERDLPPLRVVAGTLIINEPIELASRRRESWEPPK